MSGGLVHACCKNARAPGVSRAFLSDCVPWLMSRCGRIGNPCSVYWSRMTCQSPNTHTHDIHAYGRPTLQTWPGHPKDTRSIRPRPAAIVVRVRPGTLKGLIPRGKTRRLSGVNVGTDWQCTRPRYRSLRCTWPSTLVERSIPFQHSPDTDAKKNMHE